MTITVDWGSGVISVNKVDMVQVGFNPPDSFETYQLDMDVFRLALKDLEDDADEGMSFTDTHSHNTTVTVGGAILARVVIILDPYTVTFENGSYAVNLVGANTNLAEVMNLNLVQVRSANSAGLQDLNSLQAASFAGAVALDVTSQFTGTVFPVGVRATPVNNLADAISIAQQRGLHDIQILSDMTMSAGDASEGFKFIGDSPVKVALTLNAGVDVTNCEFESLTVGGTLDGTNTFRDCHIGDVTFFNGSIHECSLSGVITLGGTAQAEIYDSWSGVPGGGAGQTPEIAMGGTGQDLLIRNYAGGLELTGCTAAADASIDMSSGRVIVDNTNTAGAFWIRGIADVFDASAGTVVNDLTINLSLDDLNTLMVSGRVTPDGKVQLIDEFDTVLFEADAWEDVAGLVAHTGSAIRKVEKLVKP